MAATSGLTMPGLNALDILKDAKARSAQLAGKTDTKGLNAKAKQTAQDFESVFLNTMFQQMFTGVGGDGPFGGSGATGVWRSFLTDEYAKSFAKAGGIGIADHVYSALLAQQGAKP